MIYLVIIRSDIECTEAFTALENVYVILYTSLPRFQPRFVLNLVADTFEKLRFSCWIISIISVCQRKRYSSVDGIGL